METANTTAETPDNGAVTPKTETPIEAAIKALVEAIAEEAAERVIESPEFEGRVEQLAAESAESSMVDSGYLQTVVDDAIGGADISYQVEEVVENMDLSCQVESALDCMDLDSQVERSLESLEIPNCDHVSDIVRDVTAGLEGRMEEAERKLANLPGGLGELAKNERNTRERLEVIEKLLTMERLEARVSVEERLTELEQSTTSQFSRLDNIQIAFRGLVETMFAR